MTNVNVSPADLRAIEERFAPGDARPHFDVPRFWSNTGLQNPDTIIALVLNKPTTEDLARTIVAYGPRRVLAMLERMTSDGELSGKRADVTSKLLQTIIKGVADAARELPAR